MIWLLLNVLLALVFDDSFLVRGFGVDFVVFNRNMGRVHDNPLLKRSISDKRLIVPLVGDHDDSSSIASSLRQQLGKYDHSSSVFDFGTDFQQLESFLNDDSWLQSVHGVNGKTDRRVLYVDSPFVTHQSSETFKSVIQRNFHSSNILSLQDNLHEFAVSEKDKYVGNLKEEIDRSMLLSPRYDTMKNKLYSPSIMDRTVNLPDMLMNMKIASPGCSGNGVKDGAKKVIPTVTGAEQEVLNIVKDYVLLGKSPPLSP